MLLLMATGCSNDENNNGTEPLQKVQFSFTNEDFGADEALTRATSVAEAKPQTIDLGDCEAEISVENEPAVKTRGPLTNANGHYTIRAYQGGNLKGEVKGTFSGGAFTADAGAASNFNLDPGTYDFIAFNDDVIPSGTNLTVDRTKAETARMGFATQVITATPQKQQVMFTMKHVGARLRMQFLCKKDMPNAITSVLEAADANGIPVSVAYNPTTKAYAATNGTMTPESSNSPASAEQKFFASIFGKNYAYTSTCTDYHYFLPTTEASNLKLSFSAGTIFWKPTTAAQKLNMSLSMQPNKSYLVKIKLKPQYTYLMSDGTTGFFKETTFGGGIKTPIAVVIEPNKHIAVALQEANGGNKCLWTSSDFNSQKNKEVKTTLADLATTENGYQETWDASASLDNTTVKGNSADYPAFKACGDYDPGVIVTGANISKWYLPASGEWSYLVATLGFGDLNWLASSVNWYGYLSDIAFTQVGGTTMWGGVYNYIYWSSSESQIPPLLYYQAGYFSYQAINVSGGYNLKNHNMYVRPFVKY